MHFQCYTQPLTATQCQNIQQQQALVLGDMQWRWRRRTPRTQGTVWWEQAFPPLGPQQCMAGIGSMEWEELHWYCSTCSLVTSPDQWRNPGGEENSTYTVVAHCLSMSCTHTHTHTNMHTHTHTHIHTHTESYHVGSQSEVHRPVSRTGVKTKPCLHHVENVHSPEAVVHSIFADRSVLNLRNRLHSMYSVHIQCNMYSTV